MTVEITVLVTVGIFVLTNFGTMIYWMAKTTTLLNILQVDLKELVVELKSIKEIYMKREDVIRELANVEKEQSAMWKKIDDVQNRLHLVVPNHV